MEFHESSFVTFAAGSTRVSSAWIEEALQDRWSRQSAGRPVRRRHWAYCASGRHDGRALLWSHHARGMSDFVLHKQEPRLARKLTQQIYFETCGNRQFLAVWRRVVVIVVVEDPPPPPLRREPTTWRGARTAFYWVCFPQFPLLTRKSGLEEGASVW